MIESLSPTIKARNAEIGLVIDVLRAATTVVRLGLRARAVRRQGSDRVRAAAAGDARVLAGPG